MVSRIVSLGPAPAAGTAKQIAVSANPKKVPNRRHPTSTVSRGLEGPKKGSTK
jgi:hypothetical protein